MNAIAIVTIQVTMDITAKPKKLFVFWVLKTNHVKMEVNQMALLEIACVLAKLDSKEVNAKYNVQMENVIYHAH